MNTRIRIILSLLITSIVLTGFFSPFNSPALHGMQDQQPNILVMIADDWSFPHAGIYGDKVVRTPVFDDIAAKGMLFTNAYCAAPSCSPSRAAMLTGRYPHQLESGGNLWSVLKKKFPTYVSVLEENGYFTGKTRKGWGPGNFEAGGYLQNPAGKNFENFAAFLESKPEGAPFCFWFGSNDPHRNYVTNTGVKTGMYPEDIEVPGFLPDMPCVRNDILDYYFEVERFDRECGHMIQLLDEAELLENTILIITSDNGMPFPRAKANLYDYGTRVPLAIYWNDKTRGSISEEFVNLLDLAPTVVEMCGLTVPSSMTGNSLVPVLTGSVTSTHDEVFVERERHANVRKGDLSYPMRAIRTAEYLYIRNFEPERWPAGDPSTHQSVGQYGDVDNSISKFLIMAMKEREEPVNFFELTFRKRPGEELYDIKKDPYQLSNVANRNEYREAKQKLSQKLSNWMLESGDLRYSEPQTIYWDTVWYTPDYQFYDFNLEESIQSYGGLIHNNRGGFDSLICQP